MRRTLIIVSIVIVVLGIGAFVYFTFFAHSAGVAVAPTGTTSLPVAGQGTSSDTPTPTPATATPAPNTPNAPTTVSARLVQISTGPIVPGEVLTDASPANASSTSAGATVHYIERQSGNVFSYSVSAKQITRTSNRTVPGIQSAAWLPNASAAFVQYLSGTDFSTINTYSLPANGSAGFFLAQNISGIAVSSTSVLTLASGVNGSSALLTHSDGTHPTTVFSSPLSSLRVSFAGKGQYLAFTKPTVSLLGDAFLVDAVGHFSRIAPPQNGLVALASPSGKWALVSFTQSGEMRMELVNTSTGAVTALPVATIVDKCVWKNDDSSVYCGIPTSPSTNAAYPDDWYQGAVQFSDRIWKIDVANHYAQLVLDLSTEAKTDIDATALALNPFGTYLVFINKTDGSLWGYSL